MLSADQPQAAATLDAQSEAVSAADQNPTSSNASLSSRHPVNRLELGSARLSQCFQQFQPCLPRASISIPAITSLTMSTKLDIDRERTFKVTGRRPETSHSKEASPAAPVHRLVRRRRTLGPSTCNDHPTPSSQASSWQAILHPDHRQRKCLNTPLSVSLPCPSVPHAIVVRRAATQRNSATRTNSRCRLPTQRHERRLGQRTTRCNYSSHPFQGSSFRAVDGPERVPEEPV